MDSPAEFRKPAQKPARKPAHECLEPRSRPIPLSRAQARLALAHGPAGRNRDESHSSQYSNDQRALAGTKAPLIYYA